jgi:hypothetical protein
MSSIGVKLPLTLDSGNGFTMNKSMIQEIKQNFKMLLLTEKGERVMNPDYGVGLKRFLFENNTINWQTQVSDTINSQVGTYMPYISIRAINTSPSITNPYQMNIAIEYAIRGVNITDSITLTI